MKTIKIILPFSNEDTNKGVKVANDDEKDVYAIFLPRSTLSGINDLEKTGKLKSKMLQHIVTAGVYILVGEQDSESLNIYIGSSENCLSRVNKHHNENIKEFEDIIIFVSSKNNYNGSYGKYLESKLYELAKETGRCELCNVQNPTLPKLKENEKAKLQNDLTEIQILSEIFGLNIFKKRKLQSNADAKMEENSNLNRANKPKVCSEETLYCKSKYAQARGYLIDNKLIVLKGSRARLDETNSFKQNYHEAKKDLIKQGVLKKAWDHYIFTRDYEFNSPSAASSIVLGIPSDGREDWKNKDGKSLNEIAIKTAIQNLDVDLNTFKEIKVKNESNLSIKASIDKATEDKGEAQESKLLYCRSKDLEARGCLIDNKLIVLKGSRARLDETNSLQRRHHKAKKDLIKQGVLKKAGDHYIFTRDYEFNSPSAASALVLGRSSDGRNDWKNKDGTNLK